MTESPDYKALADELEAFSARHVIIYGEHRESAMLRQSAIALSRAGEMEAALQAIAGWSDMPAKSWDEQWPEWNAIYLAHKARDLTEDSAGMETLIDIARSALKGTST